MTYKLQLIDEFLRSDHYYLDENDFCYFYGEYTARKLASFGEINQLIFNFKKSLERKDQPDRKFKGQAIQQVSEIFSSPTATIPRPNNIVVFDDLITTGSSFKAMKKILSEHFSGINIIGLFLARRVP